MRVRLVVYGSLAQMSGGYLYDRQVVEYLRGRGVQVDVLSFPPCPYLLCPLPLPRQAAARRQLRRVLQGPASEGSCHAVVIDELVHPSLFRVVAYRRANAPALIPLVHHLKSREPLAGPLRWAARAMERRLLCRAQGILVNSRVTGETVRELAGSAIPLYLCPPGSDLLPGLGDQDDGGPRPGSQVRGTRRGPVTLLATGNLIRRKGYDLLLRMLAGLREEPWRLRVVGRSVDRTYRGRLVRLGRRLGLQARVEYTGELGGEDLAREYRRADVFVFPSRYEGYGIALAEAVRAGLPFVAFASGAVAEVTGGRGLLFPPGDTSGFAAALRRLVTDPQARREAAAVSREARADLPGWADTGRRVYEALREILGHE